MQIEGEQKKMAPGFQVLEAYVKPAKQREPFNRFLEKNVSYPIFGLSKSIYIHVSRARAHF